MVGPQQNTFLAYILYSTMGIHEQTMNILAKYYQHTSIDFL